MPEVTLEFQKDGVHLKQTVNFGAFGIVTEATALKTYEEISQLQLNATLKKVEPVFEPELSQHTMEQPKELKAIRLTLLLPDRETEETIHERHIKPVALPNTAKFLANVQALKRKGINKLYETDDGYWIQSISSHTVTSLAKPTARETWQKLNAFLKRQPLQEAQSKKIPTLLPIKGSTWWTCYVVFRALGLITATINHQAVMVKLTGKEWN